MIDEAQIAALRDSHPTVVAAGSYIMDVLGRPVAELPRGQTSVLLDEIRATPAGTAGGTAVDLARLGAQVVAAGAIGHDLAGDFVIGSLQSRGVDASRLRRKHGALTTADFLGVRGEDAEAVIAPVLPHVDIFMPNEGEALAFAGDADCVRTLPAHDAPVVDTTGCGDAFCAGVIVARCAGWEIDDAARLGCATGALNLRGLGSDAGARDVDEAVAYMREAPHRIDPTVQGDPMLGVLESLPSAG